MLPKPVDRLINDAAVMAVPYTRSVDGLKMQFATNHIGRFLFTNLTIPQRWKVPCLGGTDLE